MSAKNLGIKDAKGLAEAIKNAITLFEQASKDHTRHYDQAHLCNVQTQDILHSLELEKLTPNERNKLATKLAKLRRNRRMHKDIAEATEPIANFLQSDKGKQMLNLLREVLGKTRKIEEYHANRVYYKRVRNHGEPLCINMQNTRSTGD